MALDSKILLIFSTIFVSSTVFSTKHPIDSTTTTTIPIDFSLIPTSTHSNELPTSAIKPPHRLTKNEKIVKPNSDEVSEPLIKKGWYSFKKDFLAF